MRRNRHSIRKNLQSIISNEVLNRDLGLKIGIVGMGDVGNSVFDAIINIHSYDYDIIGSPIEKIYLTSPRGKSKKMQTISSQTFGWEESYGLEEKICILNDDIEKNAEKLVNDTDIIIFSFKCPEFNPKRASDNKSLRDLQFAIYNALSSEDKELDYRFKELPSNIPTTIKWSKLLKGYEGHKIHITNPTDIITYVSASISQKPLQESGFNHIDTWRTRNPLIRANVSPEILKQIQESRDNLYAIGGHGIDLIVTSRDDKLLEYKSNLQKQVRTYAKDMKEGLGNSSWIRKELTPSMEEVIEAIYFGCSGIEMSVFGNYNDFSKTKNNKLDLSGIFIGFPVRYSLPFAYIDDIELLEEENLELYESYKKLESVNKSLIDSGIISEIKKPNNIKTKEHSPISIKQKDKNCVICETSKNSIVGILHPSNNIWEVYTGDLSSIKIYKNDIVCIRDSKNIEIYDSFSGKLNFTNKLDTKRLHEDNFMIESADSIYDFIYILAKKDKKSIILKGPYPKIDIAEEIKRMDLDLSDLHIKDINGERNFFAIDKNKIQRYDINFENNQKYKTTTKDPLSRLYISTQNNFIFARESTGPIYVWSITKEKPISIIESTSGGFFFEENTGMIYYPFKNKVMRKRVLDKLSDTICEIDEKVRDISKINETLYIGSSSGIYNTDINTNITHKIDDLELKIYSMKAS